MISIPAGTCYDFAQINAPELLEGTRPCMRSSETSHTNHHTPDRCPDDDLDEADAPQADVPSGEAVKVLTASNFQETIANNKFVLVRVLLSC
jgi:hypothetical protein